MLHRFVAPSYAKHYEALRESGLYDELVAARLLVRHEEVDPAIAPGAFRVLRPEPIPFVSYPYEWSFGELRDAALTTLDIQQRALRRGLWLKDASAFNVQLDGCRPVFIDTLSFEVYPEGRPWVAYQQFCRHFLAPLALMAYCDADLGRLSRLHLDGVPIELASALLPLRTRLRPGLLMHLHAHARFIRRHGDAAAGGAVADGPASGRLSKTALEGLVASLRSAVRGLAWEPGGTEWADYYAGTNYSDAAHAHKQEIVASFVDRVRPAMVWDVGANTGLFSRIAARKGCRTIAFDLDPAAVERGYRECAKEPDLPLTPLVMDLRNPSTDLGWAGEERRSLASRGPADLVLALALLHHLAIGNNVPLDRIAAYLARLGKHVVIELVEKDDSQVRRLLATREDVFPDYGREGLERALEKSFRILESVAVRDSQRRMYLLAPR